MKIFRTVKFLVASWVLFSILFLIASCSNKVATTVTLSTINPLFSAADIQGTSLQSGNLYYNGFLSSDGKVLFYQSVDGKSLVKSDYDGKNQTVLSNRFPSFINIVDNVVYFIEGSASGKIYKIDADGKGETMVLDSNVKSLIVTSDYMFFIDTKDGFVYSALHDGSKKSLILDKISSQIQLIRNKIYIMLDEESKGIYIFPIANLKSASKSVSAITDHSSGTADAEAPAISDGGSAASSQDGSVAPTVTAQAPRNDVGFKELLNSKNEFNSININEDQFFYINDENNSFVIVNKDKKQSTFLKKSLFSSFILSDYYIYYINSNDESRLYRISITDPSDNEMIVNDRVFQFVVCGNSVYYRREGKLEIFRTSIEGGISDKIS